MSETSGGEVLARMLQAEGVEKVFGIIDGTYFGFYSNLHKLGIEIVTPRHETCAAHMAGAYARLTGKLGVCMASNGPGVANLLPGLVVENAEGNRVLAITSCRRPQIVYPDRGGTYQSFDQVGAIQKFSKWSHAVVSFDRVGGTCAHGLAPLLGGTPRRRAPRRARDRHQRQGEGRRGHLEPRAVPPHASPSRPHRTRWRRRPTCWPRRTLPIIHAGSGVIHAAAYDELRRVAEAAARARDDELGGPRRAARDARARDADGADQAQQRGTQRRRRRAVPRLAARRDRLVGQGAVLAASVRAADDPGRHRRPRPRRQQARDAAPCWPTSSCSWRRSPSSSRVRRGRHEPGRPPSPGREVPRNDPQASGRSSTRSSLTCRCR